MNRQEDGMEALFEFATEGILITSEQGEILRANPSANKMFGYLEGELIGKKIEILLPARVAHQHVVKREEFIRHPEPRAMGAGRELFGKRKNNVEFPVEISLSPYTSATGKKNIISFIVDITVRKQQEKILLINHQEIQVLNANLEKRVEERTLILEEALRELGSSREELRTTLEKEKELNELKSRFVTMASHEFRTPLTTMLSSLALVSKYGEQGDRPKQIRHISRIKLSISHLTDILNDVLSLSKLEEGKTHISFERLTLNDFVVDLVTEMQALAKQGQKIIYTHSGNLELQADKKILKHLLFNLISNAVKFSPEGSTITVATEINDALFTLTVSDKGIGISEEDKKHLFERFFRGYNATNIQGTGLGLNIVAKYTELMGGTIECFSRLEEGTSFVIRIPNDLRTRIQ
jgi:PAS domain S-box-containing protein